jgi:uncharacterized protein (TIGR02421 family)
MGTDRHVKKKTRKPQPKKPSGRERITDELIADVCTRLTNNTRVRRTLPEKGRLHIDRQLPFLCVYRQPVDHADEDTEKTIEGEAAYLVAPGDNRHHKRVVTLVEGVVKTVSPEFGGMLLLEVWAGDEGTRASDPARPEVAPNIRIFADDSSKMDRTVDALFRALNSIKVMKQSIEVEVVRPGRTAPPEKKPLISRAVREEFHCETIGIELPPVYRSVARDQRFPLLLRTFRHRLAIAFHKAFFAFSRSQTTHRPPHFHELGRRAVVKAVWQVDRQLSEVGSQFEYLLNVTPINTSEAWSEFKRVKFKRAPDFHYGPLPFDPMLLKRQLFKIPIERIEDAALYNLFLEKQEELDRKISMLRDRNTERFKYGSLELFGGVTKELYKVALKILATPQKAKRGGKPKLTAEQFATRAEAEIAWYHETDPTFTPKVEVTRKVAGMMVSRGKLLISPEMSFAEGRVDPLIQHEIGTHLVTWHNGASQPFRQLKAGLAGYEELQEGLAVLSEYLVDGLSAPRLRQLAGRVEGVRSMLNGKSFVETFQQLHEDHGFSQKMAYTITMRVYRGGGLTKDAVYLRGLLTVLDYIRGGGDLQPLLVGKIAAAHIPMVRELQFRKVLKPPPLTPRYIQSETAKKRLSWLINNEVSVTDLVTTNLE